jgi:ketosteroid isomerase-like protein
MRESTDIDLLHRTWEAMSSGDLRVLERALDPDAQWLGVEDGQICENRKMILTVMKRNLTVGLAGRIEETIEVGGRIVVAFRPDHPRDDGRPLDQGIAYVVVTIRDGRVIELKGCADRTAAMTYAQTGVSGTG